MQVNKGPPRARTAALRHLSAEYANSHGQVGKLNLLSCYQVENYKRNVGHTMQGRVFVEVATWNSLDIAKLNVSILTPFFVLTPGIINKSVKNAERSTGLRSEIYKNIGAT